MFVSLPAPTSSAVPLLKSNVHCGASGRWLGHEVRVFTNRIRPFRKRPSTAALPLVPCKVTAKKQPSRKWAPTRHRVCWQLDLGLANLQNCQKYISVVHKVPTWFTVFLLQQPERTKTPGPLHLASSYGNFSKVNPILQFYMSVIPQWSSGKKSILTLGKAISNSLPLTFSVPNIRKNESLFLWAPIVLIASNCLLLACSWGDMLASPCGLWAFGG